MPAVASERALLPCWSSLQGMHVQNYEEQHMDFCSQQCSATTVLQSKASRHLQDSYAVTSGTDHEIHMGNLTDKSLRRIQLEF